MEEEKTEMYLDALKEGTPFDRFVSHGHIKDPLETDIATPRDTVERIINRAIRATILDGRARLVPIIGVAGSGKTHFYWVLKDRETKTEEGKYWSCVYIPSPPIQVRILNHIYTCIVDELGANIIDKVSENLVNIYQTRKLGVFGGSMTETIEHAIRDNPGVGADVVRALITYQMGSKEKRQLCERWLLGEPLTETELASIELNSMIEEDDVCLATIKLFSRHLGKVLILYFDELEIPMRTMGESAEIKLLEIIKRIYNEISNCIVVTSCLDTVWDLIYNDHEDKPALADPALKGRMENLGELKPFTLEDIKRYYRNAMQYYWENEKNLPIPIENSLFPLNDSIFETVYEKSKGNPRESIKIIRDYLDRVLYPDGYADISRKDIIETPGIQLYERLKASPFNEERETQLKEFSGLPQEVPAEELIDSTVESVPQITPIKVEKIPPKPGISSIKVEVLHPRSEKAAKIEVKPPKQEISAESTEATPLETEAAAEIEESVSEQLKKTLVQIKIEDDNYAIEVNPQSVLGACIDSIMTACSQLEKEGQVQTELNFEFTFQNKQRTCGAIINYSGEIIGIDVPSVKSFDRSGGVAAFYAVSRLKDGINAGAFSKVILVVPKGTGGAKYTSVINSLGDKIKVIELEQTEAEALIYFSKKELSIHGKEIAKFIFPEVA